jgi:SAM-dependent methyltransferase
MFGTKNPISYVRKHATAGHVIDLGCGAGGYLAEAGSGYTLYGIDISPLLAEQANKLFATSGGRAVCASCADGLKQFEDRTFDAAILRSYLEHEPQAFEVMRNLFSKLKPGGIAVVKVPNYDSLNRLLRGEKWCGFRYPDQVNFFTPRTLMVLAKRCGFGFEQSLLDRLPTDDNFWAVLRRPHAS